ncbi:MAG TPA: DUF362 domain-containing protein [Polyangiaceae bacterium]|nr:DUF362 domain-containing protein [Polyangiaceae bacterium]
MTDKKLAPRLTRRDAIKGAAGTGAALALCAESAAALPEPETLVAKPPAGFVPMSIPGKVVKVSAKGDFKDVMQPNLLWPKEDVAKRLVEKAMMEFTGAPNLAAALGKFIHKDDLVAIKPNGIAGQKGHTMATNFELILPVVEGLIALGVPAEKIMVFEQFPTFLMGTRVGVRKWKLPEGVQTGTHNNKNHPMQDVRIYQGIPTRYAKQFLEATAVIDMSQIKDHSICGYTGCLKNITHGTINNPHDHHAHQASPQIAMLYNHPIVTSRVRLHITDGFKMTYDKGPLDKDPRTRILHGAVYVATDPVAQDIVGWKVVEEERKKRNLKTLAEVRREPRYLRTAGELGLGIGDENQIRLKTFEV